MFDLTQRLPLEASSRKAYRVLRVVLYVVLVAAAVAVTIRFIFPDRDKYFDFRIYFGPKNTIADPRFATTGKPVEKGVVPEQQTMFFNASVLGSFSTIQVDMAVSDQVTPAENGTLSVIRAYRAFLYPNGEPVTFRNGTLLTDGSRFLIKSGDTLRPFASWNVAEQMGFRKEQFLSVEPAELIRETPGTPVTDPEETFEDIVFTVQGNYYQIRDNRSVPFVSSRAYLSRFKAENALEADESMLSRFPVSDTMIGFLDGTLLSYGESVYVVEGTTLRPIDSVDTFLIKGYQWPSVIAATGEEFGMYTRGKLYTLQQPHPDGTLFHLKDSDRYYLVENGQKREIRGRDFLAQYTAITTVDIETSPEPETCTLILRRFLLSKSYGCEIPLQRFGNTTINEYQFTLTPDKQMTFQDLTTNFVSHVNRENYRYFMNELKTKLLTRYGATP